MKNVKKIVVSLVISIFLVILLQIVWNNIVKTEKQIYIALKDIYKGEKINENELVKIKVTSNSKMSNCYNLDVINKFARKNTK